MQTVREYSLDNLWRVTFTPEYPDEDGGGFYVTTIQIESSNGGTFETQLEGQVKRDGCCDWGFGKGFLWHFCGVKDTALLYLVFVDAMKIMQADEGDYILPAQAVISRPSLRLPAPTE